MTFCVNGLMNLKKNEDKAMVVVLTVLSILLVLFVGVFWIGPLVCVLAYKEPPDETLLIQLCIISLLFAIFLILLAILVKINPFW